MPIMAAIRLNMMGFRLSLFSAATPRYRDSVVIVKYFAI